MGVRVLKNEENRIQIGLSGRYSLRELLNAVDFCSTHRLRDTSMQTLMERGTS